MPDGLAQPSGREMHGLPCQAGCGGVAELVESRRWGTFWRCSACGHEWRAKAHATEGEPASAPESSAVLRARLGALSKWAVTENRTAATRPARAAFMRRFELQVDPDGVLEPDELARRAAFARRAHMTRLAMKSAAARRRRAGARKEDPAA